VRSTRKDYHALHAGMESVCQRQGPIILPFHLQPHAFGGVQFVLRRAKHS
jgi:hypothetical protein